MNRMDRRNRMLDIRFILVGVLLLTSGCTSALMSSKPLALSNARPSADVLAAEFLDRLAAKDFDGLVGLRLTKDEFCSGVWPELPAAEDERIPCDWVWQQATIRSNAGLRDLSGEHGGARYRFVSMRFAGAPEKHGSFTVLKDPRVTVTDETGATRELRLFGSMIESGGQYKLFSFVLE